MFKRLIEWFRGEINPFSVRYVGEKQTPETTEEFPWMKEERDRIEENKKKLEIAQKELDDILLSEEIFEIGDEVEYLKVPNDNVSFRVVISDQSQLIYYPMSGNHASIYIKPTLTTVQYFDSTNNY
jgi:hypothetical protein